MSAGYDGRTIVWDVSFLVFNLDADLLFSKCLLFVGILCFQIWEGTPIWTYEIGRFKLVDGKFSP